MPATVNVSDAPVFDISRTRSPIARFRSAASSVSTTISSLARPRYRPITMYFEIGVTSSWSIGSAPTTPTPTAWPPLEANPCWRTTGLTRTTPGTARIVSATRGQSSMSFCWGASCSRRLELGPGGAPGTSASGVGFGSATRTVTCGIASVRRSVSFRWSPKISPVTKITMITAAATALIVSQVWPPPDRR